MNEHTEAAEPGPGRADEAETAAQSDALENLVAAVDAEIAAASGHHPGRSGEEISNNDAATAGTAAGRYILFGLGAAKYAVPITQVLEVGSLPEVTPVPHTPSWLLGVTNLRGEILSVLDLGAFFFGESTATGASRLLVLRGERDEPFTGLVVDAVHGQLSLTAENLTQPTAPIDDPVMPYLAGVVEARGEAVGVIDLNRLARTAETSAA